MSLAPSVPEPCAFDAVRAGRPPEAHDPYALFRRLQTEAPVWLSPWGDWYLSSYDAVLEALQHPACLQSPFSEREDDRTAAPDRTAIDRILGEWLLFKNPPEHGPLRKLLFRLIKHATEPEFAVVIRNATNRLLTSIDPGGFDFVAAFARPLPVAIICDICGVPAADRPRVTEWAAAFRDILDVGVPAVPAADRVQAIAARDYFAALVRDPAWRRRAFWGQIDRDDGATPDEELANNVLFLVFSGHETTVHLVGSLLFHLARLPAVWSALRADPGLVPTAVGEALRLESPVQKLCRTNRDTIHIARCTIPAGSMMVLLLGAANRDRRAFAHPDAFDLTRKGPRHLAFGLGRHYCLGAALALREAETALSVLVDRWAEVAPSGDGTWFRNSSIRGLTSLPLTARSGRRGLRAR